MNNTIFLPTYSLLDFCLELTKLDKQGKVIEFGNSLITINPSSFYSRCLLGVMSRNPEKITLDEVKSDIAMAKGYGIRTICYTEELMPDGVESVLNNSGFVKFITQTGMIFDKDTPFDEVHDPHIISIDSCRVDEWQDSLIEGFGPEKTKEFNVYELLVTHPDIRFYAYEDSGKIIGTSVLHMNGNNSGIHEVSVVPDARRRGIANMLIRRMLTDMKENNLSCATLQASPTGFFVYEKIGFKPLSNIHTFMLQ